MQTSAGVIEADLVVDAGGRHSAIRTLLGDIGVTFREEKHDTDMAYLSRFYRLLPGVVEPDKQAFNGGTTGYLGYGVFRGDNRTFSVTIAVGTDDAELRELIDADRFDVAAAMLPAARPWVNPAVSEPIAPTCTSWPARSIASAISWSMGARSSSATSPSAMRWSARIPLYGRGCSLGAMHARLLAHALRDHGSDLEALALRMHDDVQREIVPWYAASVTQDDAARLARKADPSEPLSGVASILTEGLLPLSRIDAHGRPRLLPDGEPAIGSGRPVQGCRSHAPRARRTGRRAIRARRSRCSARRAKNSSLRLRSRVLRPVLRQLHDPYNRVAATRGGPSGMEHTT